MGFDCGIIGLPNVGKSTLFNALTKSSVDASNYPFCTIDPNVGVVPVKDVRLYQIAEIVCPDRIIPTNARFVDIAGLVKGASKGEGLGNQFLSHIKSVDAIAHVVRCFDNLDIAHVSESFNPIEDISIVETELIISDLSVVLKQIDKIKKQAKAVVLKEFASKVELLEKIAGHLDKGLMLRSLNLSEQEVLEISALQLITIKPLMYVANVGEVPDFEILNKIKKFAYNEGVPLVEVCAIIEDEVKEMSKCDRGAFISDFGVPDAGLERFIEASYKLLNLETFFTEGKNEVRAWTIKRGSTALEAAGVIHSDFIKKFIRAEVISFEDFIKYNGESGSKVAGVWRLEGKSYIVKDGDVVFFRINK